MTTKVISYSYTGNNDAFAAAFAKEIGAEHLRITEPKKRTAGMIVKENLFKKDPKIAFPKEEITEDVFAIFFGPFWFGKLSSPLRACFKQLKGHADKYGFVSLCVGFDQPEAEQKFQDELTDLMGKAPQFVILKKIADMLPSEPAPTQNMITQYRISPEDVDLLVKAVRDEIKGSLL